MFTQTFSKQFQIIDLNNDPRCIDPINVRASDHEMAAESTLNKTGKITPVTISRGICLLGRANMGNGLK